MIVKMKSDYYVRTRNYYKMPSFYVIVGKENFDKITIEEVVRFIDAHKKVQEVVIDCYNKEEEENVQNIIDNSILMWYINKLPKDAKKIVKRWKTISKSPYSMSFYNSNDIGWSFKPKGSLRLSDHWSFNSQGQTHCKVEGVDGYINKWMLCKWDGEVYHIVKTFEEE